MDVSVIIPVYNEIESLDALVDELVEVMSRLCFEHEILFVDDHSTDGTTERLRELSSIHAAVRAIRLTPQSGQSAAMCAGFREARGDVIVTLDGDGQNDPADIPQLLEGLKSCDMCCGFRANRQDGWSKRIASRIGNFFRNKTLGESIIDTGCTLKAMKAEYVRDLNVWDGMHRFLPALAAMKGARISQVPMNHRPRCAGTSKYTNLGRLKRTVWDLLGVRWMRSRYRRFNTETV